jgi:hypothetical protein
MGQSRRYLSPGVRTHLLKQHAIARVDLPQLQTRWPTLGHASMRKQMGGTLGVQSAHGAGTTVAAWAPTRKAAP